MGDGWEQVKERLFQESPELRESYEESEPAFLLASAMLRARNDLGITQAELARRMGTSQSVVSRLENMDTSPTLRTVVKVAKALECKVELRFVPQEIEIPEEEVLPAIDPRAMKQWVEVMREVVREEVLAAVRGPAPPVRGDRPAAAQKVRTAKRAAKVGARDRVGAKSRARSGGRGRTPRG